MTSRPDGLEGRSKCTSRLLKYTIRRDPVTPPFALSLSEGGGLLPLPPGPHTFTPTAQAGSLELHVTTATAPRSFVFVMTFLALMSGGAVGAMVLPPAAQSLIRVVGWRSACLMLGGMALVIGLPTVLTFIRERPGSGHDQGKRGGGRAASRGPGVARLLDSRRRALRRLDRAEWRVDASVGAAHGSRRLGWRRSHCAVGDGRRKPVRAIGHRLAARQLLCRTRVLRIATMQACAAGQLGQADLERAGDAAVRETVAALEATGSPVITDGEQTKPSFATYPVHGAEPGTGWRHHSVRGRSYAARKRSRLLAS